MKAQGPKSLYSIFIGSLTIVMLIIVSIQILYIYSESKNSLKDEIEYKTKISLVQLEKSIRPYVESYSINEYENIIETELAYEDILAIVIKDYVTGKVLGDEVYITGKIKNKNWKVVEYNKDNLEHQEILKNSYSSEETILTDERNVKISSITVYTTDYFKLKKLNKNLKENIIVAFLLYMVLFISLILLVKKYLIKPISDISTTIQIQDENGIPSQPSLYTNSFEINSLSLSIKKMIETLKESSKELKIKKDEFEAIFNNSSDGIAIIDLDSNFLNFNDSYLFMTGYTKEELLKLSCIELTLPEDRPKAYKVIEEVLKIGHVNNFEKTCVVKNGKLVSINMSLALMPDKKRLVITSRDISEIKHIQTQSKLASMGEMIGNIAHQWRQPLSIISTNASGAKLQKEMGVLSDELFYEEMDSIIRQTQYLSQTIDDFKNFIKSDDEKHKIILKNSVKKALILAEATLKNNYIKVINCLDNDFEVFGYENQLIQALLNIINNAKDALKQNIKDTTQRFVFLESKKIDNEYCLFIKDTAGGIPHEIISRVLEPYFTTKHQTVGTGIGLSLANDILLKNHNATLEVFNDEFEYENKKYKGACFKIGFKIVDYQ